uniref:Uncharacterized protein n=1 Tax=Arundo donax TaxID=35708 RepID=A0A0A8ZR52_ARUDO
MLGLHEGSPNLQPLKRPQYYK